jgi:hypothetical protein
MPSEPRPSLRTQFTVAASGSDAAALVTPTDTSIAFVDRTYAADPTAFCTSNQLQYGKKFAPTEFG